MKSTRHKFVHLRNYTQFSLSRGALRIHEIIDFCKKNKMPAAAITDYNNLFGSMEFSIECMNGGVQPIIGCNINFIDEKYLKGHILLLCKSDLGYYNLSKLLSKSYLENSSGNLAFVNLNDLKKYSQDLICMTGGTTGITTINFLKNSKSRTIDLNYQLLDIFGVNFFLEIQRNSEMNSIKNYEDFLLNESIKKKIPIVATNENYFLKKEFQGSHDVLLCISQQKYLENDDREISSRDSYLKTSQEMLELFSDIPVACENSVLIAKKCLFLLEEKPLVLPKISNQNFDEKLFLKKKSMQGLEMRSKESDDIKLNFKLYINRLNFELKIIISMGFASYFLIVSDFISWAKKNKVPVGPGRGSGAGSLVAWCLSITNLDPIKFGLLFERFLNPERVSMPDFDIDFCMDRRDDVIRYVQKKYGKSNVAQIITFGSFQARAAIRDVGRVIQLPLQQTDEICKMIPFNPANPQSLKEHMMESSKIRKIIKNDSNIKKLFDISMNLEGLLRHASTHAAGIVISDKPLESSVPLYKDPKSDFPVTQFSMKYIEKIGLIKFDFLGLKTLTVINNACKSLEYRSIKIDIDFIDLNDTKTFDLLRKGLTAGIFQLEGQGMRETLVKIQPDRFEDLIAIVSLYRPGPMDNIPTYINRKQNNEKYSYIHNDLKEILDETYGIMVYQEQVMLIAQRIAGFTLAKADLLRRAMGKKIKSEMQGQKLNFVQGCINKGIDKIKAEELFDEIEKFAGYGFNKSHAAAYAMIAYQTAFLKANYPLEFLCSLMNYEIGNFEKLAMYSNEVKKMGFEIYKPDINSSYSKFIVIYDNLKNPLGINFGLSAIKNIGETSIDMLVEERKNHGKFANLIDLLQRVDKSILNKRVFEALINSGSLNSLESNQNYLQDHVDQIISYNQNFHKNFNQNQTQLFENTAEDLNQFKSLDYKNLDIGQKLQKEIEAFGFYLSEHPTKYYESFVDSKNLTKLSEIRSSSNSGARIFSCLVLIDDFKERLSKNGKKFAFLSLSDTTGFIDSICFTEVLEKFEIYPKNGEVFIVKLVSQIFKENERFVIQEMNKITLDQNNLKKFFVSVDLKKVDYKNLNNLLSSYSNGNNKLCFLISYLNHEIEIECKNKIKANIDFLNKLIKVKGIKKINTVI